MTTEKINELVDKQHTFFMTGKTLSIAYRKRALLELKDAIERHKRDILEALKADLGKSQQEAFMCEYGLALSELSYMLRMLPLYAMTKPVVTPITNFAASSFVKPMPYGNVLVMSPWNYPFLLSIEPLIDALAAGNTVVVKPSAYSPNTSKVIARLIRETFKSEYVAVVEGGRSENTSLLEAKFDYIFFTGSQAVGKEVMKKAAEHLTPVTLELGGKSPCIIDRHANIELAARRVVFGKYLNCGQTCVAPDYILCHESVKDKFIEAVKEEIKKQFTLTPLSFNGYGKMINEKHFNRVLGLIDKDKVVIGGGSDKDKLKIEPTVMDNVTFEDAVMQEEIFGPIMPIITYNSTKQIVNRINEGPHPLALYVFTDNKAMADAITSRCIFGGGCINDTIIHLACSCMGFGGVGESGMGSYHGKAGFDTFSHKKSIVDKKNWIDLDMRYQPYTKLTYEMVKFFLK